MTSVTLSAPGGPTFFEGDIKPDLSTTASPTFTGTVTCAALTATGNVALGDAGTDTVGFYGHAGAAQGAVTGALSTVADAPAKAVLTSIIAAMVAVGLVTDGTT